jgi:hypothetical protein
VGRTAFISGLEARLRLNSTAVGARVFPPVRQRARSIAVLPEVGAGANAASRALRHFRTLQAESASSGLRRAPHPANPTARRSANLFIGLSVPVTPLWPLKNKNRQVTSERADLYFPRTALPAAFGSLCNAQQRSER